MFTEKNDGLSSIDYGDFKTKNDLLVFFRLIMMKLGPDKQLGLGFKSILSKLINHESISEIDEISIKSLFNSTDFQKKYNRAILNGDSKDSEIPEGKDLDSVYIILEKLIVFSRVKGILVKRNEELEKNHVVKADDTHNNSSLFAKALQKQTRNKIHKILLDGKNYFEHDGSFYHEIGEIGSPKEVIIVKNMQTGNVASYIIPLGKIVGENSEIQEIDIDKGIYDNNGNYYLLAKKSSYFILYSAGTGETKCDNLKLDGIDIEKFIQDSKGSIYLLASKGNKKVVLKICNKSVELDKPEDSEVLNLQASEILNPEELLNTDSNPTYQSIKSGVSKQKNKGSNISINQLGDRDYGEYQFDEIDINQMHEAENGDIYMIVTQSGTMGIWNLNSGDIFWDNKRLNNTNGKFTFTDKDKSGYIFLDRDKGDIIFLDKVITNTENDLIVCIKKGNKFCLWNLHKQLLMCTKPHLIGIDFANINQDIFGGVFIPAKILDESKDRENGKKYGLIDVNLGIVIGEQHNLDYIGSSELVHGKNGNFYKVVERDGLQFLMNLNDGGLEDFPVDIVEFCVDEMVEDNKNNFYIKAKLFDGNYVLINLMKLNIIGLKKGIKDILMSERVVDIGGNMYFEIKNKKSNAALLDPNLDKVLNYRSLHVNSSVNRVSCKKFLSSERKFVKGFKQK